MRYTIREMQFNEIQLIEHFPPEDWHYDIVNKFLSLYGKTHFTPFVAEIQGKIIGISSALVNGTVGWLGNIIVLPEFRKKGIGYSLTNHLIKFLTDNGCESFLLIATEEGKSIYQKLSFISDSEYLFYRTENFTPSISCDFIRKSEKSDFDEILRIDQYFTGEDRSHIIRHYYHNCLVYSTKSNSIEGYYLPNFGDGIIITSSAKAGIALLSVKLSKKAFVVIPEKNQTARLFLIEKKIQEYSFATRMIWGKPVNWHPKGIYCRAAGDCG